MRFRKSYTMLLAAVAVLLGGCIKNDIPFPRITQYITAFAVQDEVSPAVIDNDKYSVTVYLDEKTDLRDVKVTQFECSPEAKVDPEILGRSVDLSNPLIVTLSLYQDYEWDITAVQKIERYFTVKGQIGDTELDATGRRIVVSIPESDDLSKVTITSIKLGPADITTMSPDFKPGDVIDLTAPVRVNVTCHGVTEQWSIYGRKTALLVSTESVVAWSQVIWAFGAGPENGDNGFRYRRVDSDEWITVPKEQITFNGGNFTARIPHLEPLTTYVVQAVSDDNLGNEVTVTTQSTDILPDGSFDQWWLYNKKVWNPWLEGGLQFWDTGNTGAATLGKSNVYPSDFTPLGSGQSACLETRFVGIGMIGKLAAGSIYTGKFASVDGTNGILDFGRPWKVRPTKLKGYYQYTTAPINYASEEFKYLIDRPDSCHIYIAITDWTAPYQIRTNPKNRQLFDKNSPSVIAYGELICGESFSGYKPFEIILNYRDVSRQPSYIQITCAASKYGDYFTGGTGATLYVDQFSLDYDY